MFVPLKKNIIVDVLLAAVGGRAFVLLGELLGVSVTGSARMATSMALFLILVAMPGDDGTDGALFRPVPHFARRRIRT